VERAQGGTALPVACEARAMPLGVVVTGANATAGCQTADVLRALGVQPPGAEVGVPEIALRSLPRAPAAGA
jgi:hypothetical protein